MDDKAKGQFMHWLFEWEMLDTNNDVVEIAGFIMDNTFTWAHNLLDDIQVTTMSKMCLFFYRSALFKTLKFLVVSNALHKYFP